MIIKRREFLLLMEGSAGARFYANIRLDISIPDMKYRITRGSEKFRIFL